MRCCFERSAISEVQARGCGSSTVHAGMPDGFLSTVDESGAKSIAQAEDSAEDSGWPSACATAAYTTIACVTTMQRPSGISRPMRAMPSVTRAASIATLSPPCGRA